MAAEAGDLDVVDLLVAAGADVNVARTRNHAAPLHVAAAQWGHGRRGVQVAERLIAAGARVNQPRADGATPLDIALKFQNPGFAQALRAAGGAHRRGPPRRYL